MVAISSNLFLVSTLERPMDLREASFKEEEPEGFFPVRFLREFGFPKEERKLSFLVYRYHSHGRDEEERLEGGVRLDVEIFSVAKQP